MCSPYALFESSGPEGLCAIDALVREDVPVCTSLLSVADIKQSSRPPNRSSRVCRCIRPARGPPRHSLGASHVLQELPAQCYLRRYQPNHPFRNICRIHKRSRQPLYRQNSVHLRVDDATSTLISRFRIQSIQGKTTGLSLAACECRNGNLDRWQFWSYGIAGRRYS